MGLYRQARTIHRFLNNDERNRHVSDRKHYSQLLPQNGALCFDVGANIGRITETLLELGHKVIAFEPQQECVKEIRARCGRYKNRLTIKECALGDSPGESTLFVRDSSGRSSLRQAWEGEVICTSKVAVWTLDKAIQQFGIPQYCKIDVEGWELEVLRGLNQPLPLISLEFHQNAGEMKCAYACLDRLRSLAQIRVNITPREQSQLALERWLDVDEFKANFQAKFQGREEFLYGDLYVRMLT